MPPDPIPSQGFSHLRNLCPPALLASSGFPRPSDHPPSTAHVPNSSCALHAFQPQASPTLTKYVPLLSSRFQASPAQPRQPKRCPPAAASPPSSLSPPRQGVALRGPGQGARASRAMATPWARRLTARRIWRISSTCRWTWTRMTTRTTRTWVWAGCGGKVWRKGPGRGGATKEGGKGLQVGCQQPEHRNAVIDLLVGLNSDKHLGGDEGEGVGQRATTCGRCDAQDVTKEEHKLGQRESVHRICPHNQARMQVLLALLTLLRPSCPAHHRRPLSLRRRQAPTPTTRLARPLLPLPAPPPWLTKRAAPAM